jgi:beta-N-acetylhexosaminidase
MSFKYRFVIFLLFCACTHHKKDAYDKIERGPVTKMAPAAEIIKINRQRRFYLEDYYKITTSLDAAVRIVFEQMTIREKAAQLIMPAMGVYDNYGLTGKEILSLYRQKLIGGVLLLKGNTVAFRKEVLLLNSFAVEQQCVPLIFAADGEPALIHRKFTNINPMVSAAEQVTDIQVRGASRAVAALLTQVGAQINFAPVADRSGNKEIINRRSYGANEDSIVHKAGIFIEEHGMADKACVIKHFPGHGAVKGDSHELLVYIDGIPVEIPVFKKLIQQNHPAGVMMGHIAVKNNITWQTKGLPASLSPIIIKKLLRDSLQFKGLIFSDAMNMGAVASIKDAGFKSLAAGADVVVMPKDVLTLHHQILNSLSGKDLLSRQLEASVLRVIRLKICLGIILPL